MNNTRIAPSPTGFFHLGTARTAYFNYLAARSTGGKFILRIDDTDAARNDEKHVDLIFEALEWLGLEYDFCFRQSDRNASSIYLMTAHDMIDRGYAKQESDGAIILIPPDMPENWHDEIAGDIPITERDKEGLNLVLIRSNGTATYNFASVVDDLHFQVNHIIRGVDHITNTAKQVAVMQYLQPNNFKYSHVGLIHFNKKKLSKRDGAANLLEWKEKGYHPEAILNALLKCGWNVNDPEIDKKMPLIPKVEAVKLFAEGNMRAAPSNFDLAKLEFFNKKYNK